MGYRLDAVKMDQVLERLTDRYQVYAPAWDKAKKNVRFCKISSVSEIVLDRQSDFSVKETFYPISQVMMHFRADSISTEDIADERGILVFARPCDINGIRRLDKIFYENGQPDYYYARLREKVKIILLECRESFDNCFCVSMGSNITDNYQAAVRLETDKDGNLTDILVKADGGEFEEYFSGAAPVDFEPEFVTANKKVMNIPDINRDNLKEISSLKYWEQFDEQCIGCGGCNTVCGTCSCFDTSDIIYEEGRPDGDRRRVWSSCMIASFTEMAGGARSRKTQGANMRFKVFHKFYDFKARFGEENMCVGCGRCDMRCPKDISFFDTVNGLNGEMQSAK